jgi:hypothetical protein
MRRFTEFYGAGRTHLFVLLACFALAGYAGSLLLGDPALLTVLAWFVGAAVVHDLVLFPLYALADRLLRRLPRPRVPLVNYVRVPALGAGLTFLVFLPGIIRQGEATHLAATGLDQAPYLGRWLILVAAMFAVSALVYAIRLLTRRSAADGSPPAPAPPAPPATTGTGSAARTE